MKQNTEDARKYAAEQGVAEEEALAKGMAESSAAEIASHTFISRNRGKWTIRRIARQGEAKRSQKSKEFAEKGAQVYVKA
ncbi:MAG: hypothetical protein ABI318_23865 [Chthoniobacteraceae bacterium]